MAITRVYTIQPHVLSGTIISIEADLSRGLHSFSIVGLAGKAIEESKDRVSSAIKHSGLPSPKTKNEKIVISLAPADVKKDGPLFDLPITISYLVAAGELTTDSLERCALLGELGLDGSLQPVRGVLSAVEAAAWNGFSEIIVPAENAREAALVEGIIVYPATNLREVLLHLTNDASTQTALPVQPLTQMSSDWHDAAVALEDIKGQESAKRALIIAAAGRHNVLLVGPPGTGKTMLARAFQGILPPLSREAALAVTAIHSVAGELSAHTELSTQPPFRAPHHTASHTALVGGGQNPRPGEVTLAHQGVLFMDEFPEFERRSLDALRQPLEDKVVSIARVQESARFPADFILVAAMNPYRGAEDGTTDLARAMQETYKGKVSGPMLDRIDLWIEVPHVDYDTLSHLPTKSGETTDAREAIEVARERMATRFDGRAAATNADMQSRDIDETIQLSDEVKDLLKTSSAKLNLSPRAYHRLIKVARTIADLDEKEHIETTHVLEALQYRVRL